MKRNNNKNHVWPKAALLANRGFKQFAQAMFYSIALYCLFYVFFFLPQFSRSFTFLSVNFALLKVLDTFFAECDPFFSVMQALIACNYVV